MNVAITLHSTLFWIKHLILSLLQNIECRVPAKQALTKRNEMSYGNKPNVLAKTVTVMTVVCRSYDSRLS